MFVLFLLLGLAAASNLPLELYSLENAQEYFQEFIVKYNRQYTDEERRTRFEIFQDNLADVNRENTMFGRNVFGITKFSDMTKDEFRNKYLGYVPLSESSGYNIICQTGMLNKTKASQAPDSFDWRDKSIVSPVKNQVGCGSCYSFSATGNVESQYAIKYQQIKSLSEQQIIDCDEQCNGCDGGNTAFAITKLTSEGGSETEDDYPYEQQKGQCRFDSSRIAVKVQGCYTHQVSDPDDLKELLYTKGPLSVSLQGDKLNPYPGGIVTKDVCGAGKIDHAVLLVGYGADNGTPFWIIKNSWGADWGENGYFKIARGSDDACRMMEEPVLVSVVG